VKKDGRLVADRNGRAGRTAADTFARERSLAREIVPTVEGAVPGVEVLAVELLSPSRFCVYVDHPAGVDHALCERVTYLLDRWRNEYAIDVSSPGPEPPIRTPARFRLAVGRRVQLRTVAEIGGKKRLRGAVVAADDVQVTVATAEGSFAIPYDQIVRGNVIDEGVGGA
jgi:ribosome maturation factor RimP